MPNRFQIQQHEIAYKFIAARDGEHCLVSSCKRKPPAVKLQIDHADNNPSNWDPENLHLLCQKHNLEMRQKSCKQRNNCLGTELPEKGIDIILTSPYNNSMTNEIQLPRLKCLRCGFEWIPRQPKKPKYCARCNSPYWDKHKWKESGPQRKVQP